MDEETEAFLAKNNSAAMITLRADGTPHVARVAVALVDGRIWSSGTQSRVRTRNLRRDPRSTLFVYETGDPAGAWRWLGLETLVTILDGPEAPEQNRRLFEVMQASILNPPRPGHLFWFGQERTLEDFLQIMVDEERLIYEFEVKRTYGMYTGSA